MASVIGKCNAPIVYFESEGRQNLHDVIRVIKKTLRKRSELRTLKLVIFTATGEGPALAYTALSDYEPKMIAVTFPRSFSVKSPNSEDRYFPRISDRIRDFFNGVKIEVIVPPDLPFDSIEGMEGHNQQADLIKKTLGLFGGGLSLCVQAILRACDLGFLEEGEPVIGMSGDTAGIFVASTTKHFLNKVNGLQIAEIFCKPRAFTITRNKPTGLSTAEPQKLLEGQVSPSN